MPANMLMAVSMGFLLLGMIFIIAGLPSWFTETQKLIIYLSLFAISGITALVFFKSD